MKQQLIDIATSMKFKLDYDQWEQKGWMRFQLPDHLDEKELRWIIWDTDSLEETLKRGAVILFRAGQKQHVINSKTFTDL